MSTTYGFAVEKHGPTWFVFPASRTDSCLTQCHDLSGFMGSWDMKPGGVFFESISGETLCSETMKIAQSYADDKNGVKK